MKPLRLLTRSAVAIDLGAASLRACQLRAGAPRVAVHDALKLDWSLPPDVEVPAIPEAERLERLLSHGRFAGRDVALVVSPPLVSFFALQLPKVVLSQPAERQETAIRWEIAGSLPEPVEQFEVRWWELPHAGAGQSNVLAVAMPTRLAHECHDALARIGFRLRRIDASACALARALRLVAPADSGELCGIVDLGWRHSTLTMVVDGVPVYVRTLPPGGPAWTRTLAAALDISHELAESIKRRFGIRPGQRASRTGGGLAELSADDVPRVIFSVLREPIEALLRETLDCFSYVFRALPRLASGRLLLTGGGASMPGLVEHVAGIASMPTALLGSPEARLAPQPDFDRDLATALGGALLDLEHA